MTSTNNFTLKLILEKLIMLVKYVPQVSKGQEAVSFNAKANISIYSDSQFLGSEIYLSDITSG
jgi:hypothetical protein